MITREAVAEPAFDHYAGDYDGMLSQGIAVTGESKEYFAERRIAWVKDAIDASGVSPRHIMDFGCGTGASAPRLLHQFAADAVIGLDPSQKLIESATHQYGGCKTMFREIRDYLPTEEMDLVYCSGVFHHIPVSRRPASAHYIWSTLRPGGVVALWENNPLNPATRYIMSRIPFDRDAVTLTCGETAELLQAAGFRILRTDFLFIFPRALSIFRWIEPYLARYPLGAQYLVLAQKAGGFKHRA